METESNLPILCQKWQVLILAGQLSSLLLIAAIKITIRMGIVILSFTIKDVHDDVDHLESLGKARTAQVK